MRYAIVRFHFKGPETLVKHVETLAEAQAHCSNPETSSRTATSPEAVARTASEGPWFDGYRELGRPRTQSLFTMAATVIAEQRR